MLEDPDTSDELLATSLPGKCTRLEAALGKLGVPTKKPGGSDGADGFNEGGDFGGLDQP